MLEAGPRIGREALEAIICDAVTEVTSRAEDGTPMRYGRQSRTIPPALPRAILHRDDNVCTATAVPAPAVSKSTMSSPGAKAAQQTTTT